MTGPVLAPCACGYWHASPECAICVCGLRHSITCDRDPCAFECHEDDATTLLGLTGHHPVVECEDT